MNVGHKNHYVYLLRWYLAGFFTYILQENNIPVLWEKQIENHSQL